MERAVAADVGSRRPRDRRTSTESAAMNSNRTISICAAPTAAGRFCLALWTSSFFSRRAIRRRSGVSVVVRSSASSAECGHTAVITKKWAAVALLRPWLPAACAPHVRSCLSGRGVLFRVYRSAKCACDALLALRSTSRSRVMISAARFPSRATGKSRGRRASRRPWFYVSRSTWRRSGINSTIGCANWRCSRILRNVSTNRLRSARRAEARTNNSWRAFRDGVECGSTMQGIAARQLTSAARLRVRALCAEALMWADKPSESCCQPLDWRETYKTRARSTDRHRRFRGSHPHPSRDAGRCARALCHILDSRAARGGSRRKEVPRTWL
jgi:hypothetical protein